MKRTTRYQAAIVEHDHILLLKVIDYNHGTLYWLIPGGGQEADETELQCVQREVLEETCLHVEVVRLLLDEPDIDDGSYQRCKTYLCQVIDGEVKPGCEPEVDTADFTTIQEAGWFDLRDPGSWDPLALNDPITFSLLQRIRSVLGYLPQTAISSA